MKSWRNVFLAGLGFLLQASDVLSSDEEVQFFPSYVHWTEDGWRARVVGWVFEPERDDIFRAQVMKRLESFSPADGDAALFQERAWPFLADAEEGEKVKLLVDGKSLGSPRSGDEGALLYDGPLPEGVAPRPGDRIAVKTAPRRGDGKVFETQLRVVDAEGLSVISDIDDTIRVSSVTNKKELLAGTFFRPWRAVPGMADVYAKLAKEGAAFHYLSNGPAPLQAPLEEFLTSEKFPEGSFHLRAFSVRRLAIEAIYENDGRHKRAALIEILKDFPRRKFILVGDSAEADPELYGEAARIHGPQIQKIFIRDVTGEDRDAPRYRKAFDRLPAGLWVLFTDPSVLRP